MNYTFRITKTEPNPEFGKQLAAFEEKNRGRYFNNHQDMRMQEGYPQDNVVKDVLLVELTAEEFKKVKLEVLKAFE